MPTTPGELWERIAAPYLGEPEVTAGTGFGQSHGLRISGKIFAMLARDELVVKLPRERVDELVDTGIGTRFDPGHGRLLREWASLPSTAAERWPALVAEARAFVGA